MIQLREKRLDDRTLIQRACRLMQLVRGTATRVIVNDRPDVALATQAHGVHLGQDDMDVATARKLMGPRRPHRRLNAFD